MKRKLSLSILTGVCWAALAVTANAQVPGVINYQGRIVDNGVNFNNTGSFEFALVNPGGTVNYWSNDGTAIGQPSVAVSLAVTNGVCAVALGDTTVPNMTLAIPATVFTNSSVLLRVWFNDGVTGFQQLSPDQRITVAGYAFQAQNAYTAAFANSTSPSNVVQGSGLNIGHGNTVNGANASVAGGQNNTASGVASFVGGGLANTANNVVATVGGGQQNTASAGFATVGGGYNNQATGTGSFVGGGGTDGNTFSNNIASAGASTVGGGWGNTASGPASTVGGGSGNNSSGVASFVGGGLANTANNVVATVGGGQQNTASAGFATVGGGYNNQATGTGSFVGGGGYDGITVSNNIASAGASTVGGGWGNTASGPASTVGGGYGNKATGANNTTVAGGAYNTASGYAAAVGGGVYNQATGPGSFIGGGGDGTATDGNMAWGGASTVGGGLANGAYDNYATVGGGSYNSAQNYWATVGGGYNNTASGEFAAVAGGWDNTAGGYASFTAGYDNTVEGNYSVALGQGGTANDHNAFLWCDGTRAGVDQGADTFTVLATGGIYMFSGGGGAKLAANATSWSVISDRNAKKNFQAVDTVAVLDKLAGIAIQRWNYKWEKDSDVPHIGPMAQDFKGAFYPGRDDTGITTLEFDGVELAAIQGLNQKMEEQLKQQRTELQAKQSEIDSLMRRLAALEANVQKVSEQLEQLKAAPIQAANVRNQGGM